MSAPLSTLIQRWERLSYRQRLIVSLIGGMVLLWVVDVIALRPLRRRVHQLRQTVHETEQRLLDAVAATQQADAVTHAFAAYEPYLKSSGASETVRADVLSEVESIVRQSGMVSLDLRPSMGRTANADTIVITLEGEASPAQLIQLLDLIQRSPRLLKVTELNLRVSEGKTLRTSMTINKLLLQGQGG